jgi:hypothetical protein
MTPKSFGVLPLALSVAVGIGCSEPSNQTETTASASAASSGSGASGGYGGSSTSAGGSGGTGSGGFVVSDCGASELADVAQAMPAGFTELVGTGLDDDLLDAGGGHHILQYSDKGVWDPNTCQALFIGGGHLAAVKYIAYSASQNVWYQAPNPSWWCDTFLVSNPYECSTHAYGHNALDPATGQLYFRKFNNQDVYTHQVEATLTGVWGNAPALPDGGSCIATALEFFPERNQLVYVDCSAQGLYTWTPGAGSWETINGPFAMGPYHTYGVYNPVHHVMLFGLGNGSTGLHKLEVGGTVTQVAAPPREFHPSPEDTGTFRIFTVDPVSGDYLAYAPNGDLYAYDVAADSWADTGVTGPPGLQIAIPITSYGVVMFVSQAPAAAFLYKHVAAAALTGSSPRR